jgi:hypothetical protein
MGVQELKGRPRWDYFAEFKQPNRLCSSSYAKQQQKNSVKSTQSEALQTSFSGVKAVFAYKDDAGGYVYDLKTEMKNKKRFKFPQSTLGFLHDLAFEVSDYITHLHVYSELRIDNGQIYRASPYYQGKQWYDWAMYRFGDGQDGFEYRHLPVHIKAFVDLRFLPDNNTTRYTAGMYFVAETTNLHPNREEIQRSDLIVPYMKKESANGGQNKLELLRVDCIEGPTCLIPDLAHASKRAFLMVKPVSEWAGLFEMWVNDPHVVQHQEPE